MQFYVLQSQSSFRPSEFSMTPLRHSVHTAQRVWQNNLMVGYSVYHRAYRLLHGCCQILWYFSPVLSEALHVFLVTFWLILLLHRCCWLHPSEQNMLSWCISWQGWLNACSNGCIMNHFFCFKSAQLSPLFHSK